MTPEQRAVIALAKKENKSPMEISAEFMLHDLVQACIDTVRSQTKLYSELGEKAQDGVIQEFTSRLKKTVYTAAEILVGGEMVRVPMSLTDFKAGKDIKITGIIDSDDPGRYQLMDKAHNKAKVLVLLQDMDYFEGMSDVQSDKDQKSLNLETPADSAGKGKGKAKAEPKPVVIPEKLMNDARDFVILQQNASVDALQNQFKINRQKADTIMEALEQEGHVKFVGTDAAGRYELVRGGASAADVEAVTLSGDDLDEDHEEITVLSDELFSQIRASVIARQNADLGVLIVDHGVSEEVAKQAIDRLEMDGVITAEDDLGGRGILIESA